jgi:hypothetical protein
LPAPSAPARCLPPSFTRKRASKPASDARQFPRRRRPRDRLTRFPAR